MDEYGDLEILEFHNEEALRVEQEIWSSNGFQIQYGGRIFRVIHYSPIWKSDSVVLQVHGFYENQKSVMSS